MNKTIIKQVVETYSHLQNLSYDDLYLLATNDPNYNDGEFIDFMVGCDGDEDVSISLTLTVSTKKLSTWVDVLLGFDYLQTGVEISTLKGQLNE